MEANRAINGGAQVVQLKTALERRGQFEVDEHQGPAGAFVGCPWAVLARSQPGHDTGQSVFA